MSCPADRRAFWNPSNLDFSQYRSYRCGRRLRAWRSGLEHNHTKPAYVLYLFLFVWSPLDPSTGCSMRPFGTHAIGICRPTHLKDAESIRILKFLMWGTGQSGANAVVVQVNDALILRDRKITGTRPLVSGAPSSLPLLCNSQGLLNRLVGRECGMRFVWRWG